MADDLDSALEAESAGAFTRPVAQPQPKRERAAKPDREIPHSQDAEEHLLSCVLLDGAEVMAKCEEAKLTTAAFYTRANALIFERLRDLHSRKQPLELAVLAEDLKACGKLAEVGGIGALVQMSGRTATTAQVAFFIDKVRDLAVRRELIRYLTVTMEQAYSHTTDGLDEFLTDAQEGLKRVVSGAEKKPDFIFKGANSFPYPEKPDANQLLGTEGWAKRGLGGMIIGPMGQGKSSIIYDMCLTWCLGKSFPPRSAMGIPTQGKWKFCIVQCEDDDYYIGQVVGSYYAANKLTQEQRNHCDSHVQIATVKGVRGVAFLAALDSIVKTYRPDFLIINPLLMYLDGDPSDQVASGNFLTGLDAINAKYDNCTSWIIVHHTGKPPTKEKGAVEKMDWESAYSGFGSSMWANWPRWIAVLEPRAENGRYLLRLAKSGSKAGLVREYEIPQGAGHRIVREVVTRLPLRHSQETIDINGLARPVIEWEADEWDMEDGDEEKEKAPKDRSGVSDELMLTCWCKSDSVEPIANELAARTASEKFGISRTTYNRRRAEFLDKGWLRVDGNGWRRTAAGDDLARRAAT